MKRYILFSNPTKDVMPTIIPLLFPKELENKVLAYMPCEGWSDRDQEQEYTNFWIDLARKNNTTLLGIDNAKPKATNEIEKLKKANILLITGGNTYTLLRNIRNNHIYEAMKDFTKKDNFVMAGWSAGALILTPSIALSRDANMFGIVDLTALNLVPFEVLPHYQDSEKEKIDEYKAKTKKDVRTIKEDEYIII